MEQHGENPSMSYEEAKKLRYNQFALQKKKVNLHIEWQNLCLCV